MDRVKFLVDALEITQVQATIFNKLLLDIPNDKLMDFIVFRMSYIEPMQSKELITKNALFDFRKKQYLESVANGEFFFLNTDEVKEFCKTYFKGQDLCYGPGNYYDYVIIAMDKDGVLINKFCMNDGYYLKLNSKEESEVYSWLFENQKRIGVVKIVPYFESKTKQIENKQDDKIDNKILQLLGSKK